MPTIDELSDVSATSDTDELPISQGGVTMKTTRAQLLANTQPQILLSQGSLLGRASAGSGGPEAITLGSSLALTNGVLSAPVSPGMLANFPAGTTPAATDIVPLSQGGSNARVPFATFMNGLAGLSGINLSQQLVQPTGGTIARTLANATGDMLSVEAFGAAGDGVTDDTAAIQAALNSGKPLRFGPRTYVLNGPFTINRSTVLFGTTGQTVLQRHAQNGGNAWITMLGPGLTCTGITFDANRSAITQDTWSVVIAASCISTIINDCVFINAQGPTMGCGLAYLSSDPTVTQHVVRNCRMRNNALHGLWLQAVDGVGVYHCLSHDNGGHGILVDYQDPAHVLKAHNTQIIGNECWNNLRGIAVGNYTVTNTPPGWNNANPDVIGAIVLGNNCHNNTQAGIAAAGTQIAVAGNLCVSNATGILANITASQVNGNIVSAASAIGIDARGAVDADITSNHVSGCGTGVDASSGQRVRVGQNMLFENGWAIVAANVATDPNGNNYGQAASVLTLTDNAITIGANTGGGISLVDAPQNVLVARNAFAGLNNASAAQALWAHTDSVTVRDNRWNNTQLFTINPVTSGGMQQVQIPDVTDNIAITSAPSGVQSMMTLHQIATAGSITYVKVTNGGSGYTHASVALSGAGAGATAVAYVAGGSVIGIAVTNPGSGYGGTTAVATATITGDGTGANATVAVGLPLWNDRRLRITCAVPVTFNSGGSMPHQSNWTGFDVTVPANAAVEFFGNNGQWIAGMFPGGDYFTPLGNGAFMLRTLASGNLTLHPAGNGVVQIASDQNPIGYSTCLGHGSPQSVVTAPPGSDYRNLDGGVGTTLWIKQTGTGNTGWVAIA